MTPRELAQANLERALALADGDRASREMVRRGAWYPKGEWR